MVYIYLAVIVITVTYIGVTHVQVGFLPLVRAEASTGTFLSSVLVVYLILK